jgi:hypothetical protein
VLNFCPGFRTFSSEAPGAIVSGPCKTHETARQSMFGFKGIDFKTDRWLYNVTVYPGLRMLRVEGQLYRPIQWQPNESGLVEWDQAMARLRQGVYQSCLVSSLPGIHKRTCLYAGPRTSRYALASPDGPAGPDAWWCTWDSRDTRGRVIMLVYLRRIQRAAKAFLLRGRRRLAVAMALHARLGAGSTLAALPGDLLAGF